MRLVNRGSALRSKFVTYNFRLALDNPNVVLIDVPGRADPARLNCAKLSDTPFDIRRMLIEQRDQMRYMEMVLKAVDIHDVLPIDRKRVAGKGDVWIVARNEDISTGSLVSHGDELKVVSGIEAQAGLSIQGLVVRDLKPGEA